MSVMPKLAQYVVKGYAIGAEKPVLWISTLFLDQLYIALIVGYIMLKKRTKKA
jgi:hypothetical protein